MRKGKGTPTLRAAKAKAIRALIPEASGKLHRVEYTIEMTDGSEVRFEMEVDEAGRFIEMQMAAYNAILPPLKTSRGGFGL